MAARSGARVAIRIAPCASRIAKDSCAYDRHGMCRLFGMSAGSEPARATFWLLDAPDSLSAQSHREPDGTGLGWFDELRAPHVSKQALAAYSDRRFAREAREVSATTFVAHVRFAS